jgi:hypothetical protein
VGWVLEQFSTLVHRNVLWAVDVHLAVGVHGDAYFADVRVDYPGLESENKEIEGLIRK